MSNSRPKQSINYWIHALSSSLTKAAMHYFGKKFGLRLPEMRILSTLGSHGDLAARDLVTWTAMDKGMVSRVLAGLAEDGYVVQQNRGSRARLRRWALTPLGEDLVRRLRPVWRAREAHLQRDLTAKERETLTDLLERLFWASEEMAAEEARSLAKKPPAQVLRSERIPETARLRRTASDR